MALLQTVLAVFGSIRATASQPAPSLPELVWWHLPTAVLAAGLMLGGMRRMRPEPGVLVAAVSITG